MNKVGKYLNVDTDVTGCKWCSKKSMAGDRSSSSSDSWIEKSEDEDKGNAHEEQENRQHYTKGDSQQAVLFAVL